MATNKALGAVSAKALAAYGRRLAPQNYREMLQCKDLPDLIAYLKNRTAYRTALQGVNSLVASRAQLEGILRQSLLQQYDAFCRFQYTIGDAFYRYFVMRAEIQQIMDCLQTLNSSDKSIALHTMPLFIQKRSGLNLPAVQRATTLPMLIQALEGTPYARVLEKSSKRADFSMQAHGLLQLEAALDCYFYQTMQGIAKKHQPSGQAQQTIALLQRQSDLRAMIDLYRLKSILPNASPLFLEQCLCITVTALSKKQWARLLAAKTAGELRNNLQGTPYAAELAAIPFTYVEDWVRRAEYRWCKKQLRFSQNAGVVLLCYAFLAENELANLIHSIEAVRYDLPLEQIAEILLGVQE